MSRLFKSWVWRMARRDARRGTKTILLSMFCVILGTAAVVAAFSFRDNLQSSIRAQSKSLLGADLAIGSREAFSPEAEDLIASLGGDQSRQVAFSSMAYFPGSGNSRLVQVRAIGGNFPYYGTLETDPPSETAEFQRSANALVDETLMHQINARLGERVQIGDQQFRIVGKLLKIPGETLAVSLISPRIYIPLAFLGQTQLIRKGSLVRYRVFFKLDSGEDVDRLVQRISPQLSRLRLDADTATRRMARISRSTENLSRYLQLAVFIAVLLAGVGVASAAHVYAKEKTASVAVLRCIGASPGETVVVYLIQAAVIALAGSLLGAALGMALQFLIPLALQDFLPVSSIAFFSLEGLLAGVFIGLGAALLFALIPLIGLRKISPLLALRSSYESGQRARDPLLGLILFLIVATVFAFATATTERWFHGLWFTLGVFVVFALLMGLARAISIVMKKTIPAFLPFAWRQGLANLHRPNNQTAGVTLAVGLGTFLFVTLYSVQSMLLNQVLDRTGSGEPNLVLFDVQKDQRQPIAELLQSFNLRLYEEVPIVTMRLAAIKDKSVEELRVDPHSPVPAWALRREYRSTYRGRLTSTEKLAIGRWHGRVAPDTEPIPISLENGIADTLQVTIGDEMQFELHGVTLRAQVASLREVDWQRVQPNFFVVFPEGVLESAPQFYAVVTRTDSSRISAQIQRLVVERFPNISIIDLTLVLQTLNTILGRVSDAIGFVALFTILTGFAVLVSAVVSSRGQRLKESILMRTLGAPRSLILTAIVAEYLFLAVISCLAGAALASLATWALSFYFLETIPTISWAPIVLILLAAAAATVLAGVIGCLGIFRRPALEALRAET